MKEKFKHFILDFLTKNLIKINSDLLNILVLNWIYLWIIIFM